MRFMRRQSAFILLISLFLIAVIILAMFLTLSAWKETSTRLSALIQMEENRQASEEAILTFMKGSDILTNEVWQFAATEDVSHMEHYCRVVEVELIRENAIGKLLRLDLTDQEKAWARRAKADSDFLMAGELWAMRLVSEAMGLTEEEMPTLVRECQLTAAETAMTAADKRQAAADYLFGQKYSDSKQRIVSGVEDFRYALEQRYSDVHVDELNRGVAASKSSGIILSAVFLVLIMGLLLYYITIAKKDRQLSEKNEQLKAALRSAESANAAKSQFTSRMSHEIRTPLNAVIGYMAMAEDSSGNEPQMRDCLEKATLAANHLLGLISDVLDMSSIESGKMKLAQVPFDLKQLITTVSMLYHTQCRQHNIAFATELNGVTAEWLIGDQMRLNQILMNLLSNAVKFTPAGGKITLAVAQIASSERQVELRFTVADTGIGMDQAFMDRLFEPFEQQDAQIALQFGGTGLGLAITENLVAMMGGEIHVDSAVGAGSTFTVELRFERDTASVPLPSDVTPAQAPASDGEPAEPAKLDFSGRRALLVEDHPMNQEIARYILTTHGFTTDLAENGAEAVTKFAAAEPGRYDLILMDVKMPVLNGYDATRQIRALPREDAATVPIIAMTADAFAEDIAHARAAGMNDHVSKPIDVDKLLAAIERHLPKG